MKINRTLWPAGRYSSAIVPIESAVLFELIHILLLPNLAFDSLFRCFLSESVNLLFGPRFELDSFELDFDMFLSLAILSIRMHNGDGHLFCR
jgi:hypothetical protein